MSIIVFFIVVISFSLTLNAIDKIRSYNKKDKSVWIDSDSVVVKRGDRNTVNNNQGFMTRVS